MLNNITERKQKEKMKFQISVIGKNKRDMRMRKAQKKLQALKDGHCYYTIYHINMRSSENQENSRRPNPKRNF